MGPGVSQPALHALGSYPLSYSHFALLSLLILSLATWGLEEGAERPCLCKRKS